MIKTRESKSKSMKYYSLFVSRQGGPGYKIINYDKLQQDVKGLSAKEPWPDGTFAVTRGPWTIPDYVEAPHIVINKRKKNNPTDLDYKDGFLFISSKCKQIFERLAPDACEYRLCRTEFSDGTPGPEMWMCSIVKAFRDSIDLSKSTVGVSRFGTYGIFDGDWLVFLKDIIGDAHLFRVAQCASIIFCDEIFKKACMAEKLRGPKFELLGEVAE